MPSNIGLNVTAPAEACTDVYCPFHGTLKLRGVVLEGEVATHRMSNAVVVKRERLHFVEKYERYEKRTSRYPAHLPPCLKADVGSKVKIAECRPLAKTIAFCVIEVQS